MVAETGGGIPRIIHQIWIGKNPMPHEWMDTVKDFAANHGYEYKLWTDITIDKELRIPDNLRAEYDSFKGELAGRADIIRLLVLHTYGGIYVDADSVIMKADKLADFLKRNTAGVFFAWENLSKARTKKLGNLGPGLTGQRRLVANGIIGARKGHPFIQKLIDGIANAPDDSSKKEAWKRVGPLYVTRTYMQSKKEFPDIHIYPMKYFYPMHWGGITDPELHTKVKIPGKSMMFQYGYSTNNFAKIFAKRNRRRTRKARKD
jgi:mannosyltransferase OCH1-like enzyme